MHDGEHVLLPLQGQSQDQVVGLAAKERNQGADNLTRKARQFQVLVGGVVQDHYLLLPLSQAVQGAEQKVLAVDVHGIDLMLHEFFLARVRLWQS